MYIYVCLGPKRNPNACLLLLLRVKYIRVFYFSFLRCTWRNTTRHDTTQPHEDDVDVDTRPPRLPVPISSPPARPTANPLIADAVHAAGGLAAGAAGSELLALLLEQEVAHGGAGVAAAAELRAAEHLDGLAVLGPLAPGPALPGLPAHQVRVRQRRAPPLPPLRHRGQELPPELVGDPVVCRFVWVPRRRRAAAFLVAARGAGVRGCVLGVAGRARGRCRVLVDVDCGTYDVSGLWTPR